MLLNVESRTALLRARTRLILALVLLGWLVPSPARAQAAADQPSGLASLLPAVILREIRLPAPGSGFSHEAHFSPLFTQDLQNPAVAIVEGFNTQLALQLSTFPLGTSTGGLTYTFDPALGTFLRTSDSFGPAFAERALTIGRGRFSGGITYQHAGYSRFEGNDLRDGSIRFYLRHLECCTTGGPPGPPTFGVVEQPDGSRLAPFFEGDIIEAALSLKATTDTFAFFASYGLTDRWDAGIAVPIVRVDLEATVTANILRLATESNPAIHTFEAGNPDATSRTLERSGTATGLGDIALRTKYRIAEYGPTAIAAAADIRLPTGDAEELLSAGAQTKLFLIVSGGSRRWAHHANFGYTASGGHLGSVTLSSIEGPSVPDEVNYAGGSEFIATPRLTIIGDVIGRVLRSVGRLEMVPKPFEFTMPSGSVSTAEFSEFDPRPGNLHAMLGALGAKFNPTGDLLLSGNVLFPLTDSGLKTRLAIVLGIDYAF
jgi:hypothetical protein